MHCHMVSRRVKMDVATSVYLAAQNTSLSEQDILDGDFSRHQRIAQLAKELIPFTKQGP